MAKYIIKKYVYKNGLLDHKRPLDREFKTEIEARKYAYKLIQGKGDNLGIFKLTQRGAVLHEDEVAWLFFRDFKNLYPYGKWTFYNSPKQHALLNPDGTIDRRSESTIANERESKSRKK